MKTLILLIFCLTNAFAATMNLKIVEANKEDGVEEQLLALPLPGSPAKPVVGSVNMGLLGICTSPGCVERFTLDQRSNENYSRMNGLVKIKKSKQLPFPKDTVESKSTVTETLITSEVLLLGATQKMQFKTSDLNLMISFAEKDSPSLRKDFTKVDSNQASLAKKVFQIVSDSDEDGLGSGQSMGTGFFIGSDGYILTNRHVVSDVPDCLSDRVCKLQLKRKLETVISETVSADLLTCSKKMDFCLLRITGANNILPDGFRWENGDIPLDLLTLGFPADKNKLFPKSKEEEISLTYSFGSPVGLNGLSVSSSMYAYHGASGSPIITTNGFRLVGIISNITSEPEIDGEGALSLFRPSQLIEKKYQISKYLNGSKQTLIDSILKDLATTRELDTASQLMTKFGNERSFYGLDSLEELRYDHPVLEIRKLISNFLKKYRPETF